MVYAVCPITWASLPCAELVGSSSGAKRCEPRGAGAIHPSSRQSCIHRSRPPSIGGAKLVALDVLAGERQGRGAQWLLVALVEVESLNKPGKTV